MSWRKI